MASARIGTERSRSMSPKAERNATLPRRAMSVSAPAIRPGSRYRARRCSSTRRSPGLERPTSSGETRSIEIFLHTRPSSGEPWTPSRHDAAIDTSENGPRIRLVQKLEAGIHHFQSTFFASNRGLFEQLAERGQRPETLFITCSDSRVVPTLITNAAPGELFIVRNVGNIVPAVYRGVLGGVSAAIEYAVEILEVDTAIVCGHTNCGAIDAILHPERVRHLPFVSRWLTGSQGVPALIAERYGHL